ncbi:sulfatase family protein [Aquimarina algicola]|uniref:Sulfatase n=1 Tax=Aquimarina algicola TaxID=2589995 RepID=A0A504J611_9FLAO|nr:sulfatase [Aquimarina algicola]TPN86227.1 sulfatase [Aquimarina algicola]
MQRLYKYILFFISVFVLTSCVEKQNKTDRTKKQKKPNIIWLMAEDISTDLACYGMPNVKTPNLDKMAAQGVRFDNAFVTNPICSPSRSAMMIGTHQVKTNTHHHRSNRNVPLDSTFKPYTYWLKNAGYTTILGHHAVMDKGRKIDVNFKHKPLGIWNGKTQFGLFDKYDTFEKADEPFFAQIQLKVTHRGDWWDKVREQSSHPVDPKKVIMPPYMADHPMIRLDWAKYLDQIEYMDHEVGMIFKELEEKGMAENTIVIFIGDNGRCNIRGKGYLHDPGLRIPLIVYYPKQFKESKIRKDVVSATDITATILDFAGIKIPEYMTGKPIFDKDFNREYVYGARDLWDEIEEQSRGITSADWKYIRNDKPEVPYDAHQIYLEFYRPAVHIMRTLKEEEALNEAQKFFFEDSKPVEELYNLQNDPHELVNLAKNPKYAYKLTELRSMTKDLDQKMIPVSTVYEPKSMEQTRGLVEWLKNEYPEVHKQMENGVEIGFKKWKDKYGEIKKGQTN